MVASTDVLASRVGRDVLVAGGNAVDGAVATALALAVVNPEAGNLGGSGYAVVRTADEENHALDFRSTAPAAATRTMYLDGDGALTSDSELGPLAAAVPGSVHGLWTLHQSLGSLPWSAVVQPAVTLAEGFTVGERLTRSYPAHIIEGLRGFRASADIYLPDGAPPALGSRLCQPDLARVLARIRDHGADGFYAGATAADIESAMQRHGGIMTAADLAAYRSVWREPLECDYRDHRIVSMPPSSSGGVALVQIANMLHAFDVTALQWHGADHVHLFAEVWKRAFADRNHELADPAFPDIPMETLLATHYAEWRMRYVSHDGRATPADEAGPGVGAYLDAARQDGMPRSDAGPPRPAAARRLPEGDHTTHLSVVDGDGCAVALTTTLNTWYGSKFVADGTGVLLNNDMDDLSAKPGAPNHFGLVQGEANAIAPGKRPLSAMTPTIVLNPDGQLRLVVGNAGGATILTTVFQLLSSVLDHGLAPPAAMAAPRIHHQHLPDRIQYEPGGLAPGVVAELTDRGHALEERKVMSGDAHVVAVDPDGGLIGLSDPRRGGEAVGF